MKRLYLMLYRLFYYILKVLFKLQQGNKKKTYVLNVVQKPRSQMHRSYIYRLTEIDLNKHRKVLTTYNKVSLQD